jgi:RNA polymerase sigma-70 factor (ECF subfamily)
MESDEALYERLIEGDIGAFDRLYDRHARALFGFLCVQLRDPGAAEDALHETFMALLRESDAGRQVRSFKAWAYQVARNLCLNRARSHRRAARALQQVAQACELSEGPAHPEQQLAHCEQAEALRQAVHVLPQPLAELYQLRAAGLSSDELAQVLGIPVGTVKSRTHEMVKRLREEMVR